jgi:hypothetical protein
LEEMTKLLQQRWQRQAAMPEMNVEIDETQWGLVPGFEDKQHLLDPHSECPSKRQEFGEA